MGVVADLADRIAVMRTGRIVETGTAERDLQQPAARYTQALLAAVPHLGGAGADDVGRGYHCRLGRGDRRLDSALTRPSWTGANARTPQPWHVTPVARGEPCLS